MKVQELRIGNLIQLNPQKDWVNGGDLIVVVESISNEGINYTSFRDDPHVSWDALDDDKFVPIAITKEWLEKFGLRVHNKLIAWGRETNVQHVIINEGFMLCHIKEADKTGWFIGFLGTDESLPECAEEPEIKYIHQLQNLYLALTGEELHAKD